MEPRGARILKSVDLLNDFSEISKKVEGLQFALHLANNELKEAKEKILRDMYPDIDPIAVKCILKLGEGTIEADRDLLSSFKIIMNKNNINTPISKMGPSMDA